MSIAHLVGYASWGGMEARALETARWQAEDGHRVVLVAPPGSVLEQRCREAGLAFEPVEMRQARLRAIGRLRDVIARHAVLVADAHGNCDSAYAPAFRDLCAVVRTRHTLKRQPVRSFWRRLRFRWSYDHVVATSAAACRELVATRMVEPEAISVVGEWAGEGFFPSPRHRAAANATRARLGLPAGVPIIGTTGMLRADNAVADLLHAHALMCMRRNDVVCLVVGGPPSRGGGDDAYMRHLNELASRLGAADRVRFLGHRDDVADLLDVMDVVAVLPRHTAQTRIVPEAFARARAVVAYRVGALSELIDDGITGTLVEAGNVEALGVAIGSFLDDPGRRLRVATNARAFAEANLRQEPKMHTTLEAYRRAIAQRERRRLFGRADRRVEGSVLQWQA